jgi:ribosomal protein S12 methylthiotransferase
MLRMMRRETSRQHIEDLIHAIREGIPGIALRTTFIVGFPGETEDHFESLLEFIERTRFERLGIFTYSQEEGSRAAKMDGQVPTAVKNARYRRAMALQQKIAAEIAQSMVGREINVLVEEPLIARSESDAPDVDTRVLLSRSAPVGQFAKVRVSGTQMYDLRGDVVAED